MPCTNYADYNTAGVCDKTNDEVFSELEKKSLL